MYNLYGQLMDHAYTAEIDTCKLASQQAHVVAIESQLLCAYVYPAVYFGVPQTSLCIRISPCTRFVMHAISLILCVHDCLWLLYI